MPRYQTHVNSSLGNGLGSVERRSDAWEGCKGASDKMSTPFTRTDVASARRVFTDGWRESGEIRSARPTRARAPALGSISPAREERRHEPALRTGLDGERRQRERNRDRNVIVFGPERHRPATRGMRFVHPHRRVLEAAELRV